MVVILCLLASIAEGDGMSPEAKKEFGQKIASKRPEERAQAIALLSQADNKKAFKLLVSILVKDHDEKVLEAALGVLKGFTDKKVISLVGKQLKKCTAIEVRVIYVKALWEYDDDESFGLLQKFVKDQTWQVRLALADCFGEAAKKKGFEKAKIVIDTCIKWLFKEPDGRTQNHIRAALYYNTGKDYGLEKAKWEKWWSHARPLYGKPKKTEDNKPVDKDGDGKPDMTTELPKKKWREPVAEEDASRPRPKFFGHELKNARVAFVIDSSGSMGEAAGAGKTKLDVVKEEMLKTIKAFDKRYWFNMFYYSDFCGSWKKKLQKATEATKKVALQWVKGLGPLRMTNIGYALKMAADDADTDTIILLSDGLPTVGITDVEALLRFVRSWNKHKKIKINTVGMVGCDPSFLQRLAQQNGGSFTNAP
jgi:hypothetical protein